MRSVAGEVILVGRGLHSGAVGSVVLRKRRGPVAFRAARDVPLHEARVVDTNRATSIAVDGRRIRTVEHLLAAFGGLGVQEGVSIEVDGSELPFLDGGARAFCDALRHIGASENATARLEVARDGEVSVGGSTYRFQRGDVATLSVTLEFADDRLAREARWDGDPDDFVNRIAPARTFAFAHELEKFAEQGLASHVTPESVVVLADGEVLTTGRPYCPDEPARHKLLDLVGDLFLHGGPPRGAVRVQRPGHGATRAALREAFERGLVRRVARGR